PETNCTRIANEKCRRAYTQIQTLSSVIPQLQMLHSLAEGCPPEMTDFWQCINGLPGATLGHVVRLCSVEFVPFVGSNWVMFLEALGRVCVLSRWF
ncbi:reversion-inducing cysteine-rich protein with Kazal motifs, partial [Biomphalaria glabrata]